MLSSNMISDMLKNFTDFVNEKCQLLLDEYDSFYCVLTDAINGVRHSKILRKRLDDLFAEIGGDDQYERLINGNDFETIFRNILSSALVKLAQLMTECLDQRFADVRMRKLSIENFMERYFVVDKSANNQPSDEALRFQSYNNNLYESI